MIKFGKNGGIYWINDLKSYEGGANEHLSFHASGQILRTSTNPRERYGRQWLQSAKATVWNEGACVTVWLHESYFYDGLVCPTKLPSNALLAKCTDAALIGSQVDYTIGVFNTQGTVEIERQLEARWSLDKTRAHLFRFGYLGRTLFLYMEFTGGDGSVDEQKLAEANARAAYLTNVKICVEGKTA